MADIDLDIEAYLEQQVKESQAKDDKVKEGKDEDRKSRRERDSSKERRKSSRSRSTSERKRHSRSRSAHRRRRDSRDRDRKRRSSRDRSRDRNRDRSRDRRRERSEKDKTEDNELQKELERERKNQEDKVKREEAKRRAELDDLTKDQRTIFVGQLVAKVTEDNLRDFFGQVGNVKNIIMIRDKYTNKHKGIAYVEMEDLSSIPTCLLFNEKVPDFQKFNILVRPSEAEKNIAAKTAGVAKSNGPDTRIYVGNIHLSLDETTLRSIVEQFGAVESVNLHRDDRGVSKGFAFVKYREYESAMLAMNSLGTVEIMGRVLKVGPVFEAGKNPYGSAAPGTGNNANNNSNANATGNWNLDDDDGNRGMHMNSQSRMMLMAKLSENAGIQAPVMPQMPAMPMQMPFAAAPLLPDIAGNPSQYLMMTNMFDSANPPAAAGWDEEIRQDVLDRALQFGTVEFIKVLTQRPGGLVLVKMGTVAAATMAGKDMHGKAYDCRQVLVSFLEPHVFANLAA